MHGHAFMEASPGERVAVLTRMAKNEMNPKTPEEVFFRELKHATAHASRHRGARPPSNPCARRAGCSRWERRSGCPECPKLCSAGSGCPECPKLCSAGSG